MSLNENLRGAVMRDWILDRVGENRVPVNSPNKSIMHTFP